MKNENIQIILSLLKTKYKLKTRRKNLVIERREIGKRIYNLSMEIEKLDDEAAALMAENGN